MCLLTIYTVSGAIEFEEADLSSLTSEGANGTDEIPRLEKPSKTPGTLILLHSPHHICTLRITEVKKSTEVDMEDYGFLKVNYF